MRSSVAVPARTDAVGPAARQGAVPLDLVHLTRQTFGDKRLETELLRLFMHQAASIGRALGEEDEGGQHDLDLLHTLAGSARAVGATDVATLASAGEAALRRGGGATPRLDEDERRALRTAIAAVVAYVGDLLDQA